MSPLHTLLIFMFALLVLLLKVILTAAKYILVDIGILKSPRTPSWSEVGKIGSFFLGTDIKGRARAISASTRIFSSKQDSKMLFGLAKSFRKGLLILGISLTVAIVGVVEASGQANQLMFGLLVALAVAIWGIIMA